jgi:hypothetical protein
MNTASEISPAARLRVLCCNRPMQVAYKRDPISVQYWYHCTICHCEFTFPVPWADTLEATHDLARTRALFLLRAASKR